MSKSKFKQALAVAIIAQGVVVGSAFLMTVLKTTGNKLYTRRFKNPASDYEKNNYINNNLYGIIQVYTELTDLFEPCSNEDVLKLYEKSDELKENDFSLNLSSHDYDRIKVDTLNHETNTIYYKVLLKHDEENKVVDFILRIIDDSLSGYIDFTVFSAKVSKTSKITGDDNNVLTTYDFFDIESHPLVPNKFYSDNHLILRLEESRIKENAFIILRNAISKKAIILVND